MKRAIVLAAILTIFGSALGAAQGFDAEPVFTVPSTGTSQVTTT